jgi:uncharacterized protein (TIGR02996 family)
MVRLEFKEGTSSKFWELAIDGSAYNVRWGRIGSNGQEKRFSFPTSAKAQAEADKLIAEKKKKGYQETGGKGGASAKKAATKPAPASPRNPELEKLIARNPKDTTNHVVYGDWLSAQGDPRGELVTVQNALEALSPEERKGARGKSLAKRAADILRKHDRFLPGVKPANVQVGWRSGFIESVTFNTNEDWMENEVDIAGLAKAVLASSAAAGLSAVELGLLRWDYVGKDIPLIIDLIGKSPLGEQIATLRINPLEKDDVDVGMYDPGKLDGISSSMPGLESLTVKGNDFSLGTLNLPKLTKLAVQTCGFTKKHLKSVLEAKLPKLEHLELWFGSENYGAQCKTKDLGPILEGKVFPKVTHLGLMNAEFTDAICSAVGTSKILKRLKVLDLSLGTMSEAGVKAILADAKSFAHLTQLNVNDNFLSKKDIADLKKAGLPVFSKEQKDVDDSIEGEIYRYVSVAE